MRIGVLYLQGDREEHEDVTKNAAHTLGIECDVLKMKRPEDFEGIDGLIIPGGESTTMMSLSNEIREHIKRTKNVFGTCAGGIIMWRLGMLDIELNRNAYGSQKDSFEDELDSVVGKIKGVFIRAPRITNIGTCNIIATHKKEPVGVEKRDGGIKIACTFHPELVTTKFHEYFLNGVVGSASV